jgi:hypothetical protein
MGTPGIVRSARKSAQRRGQEPAVVKQLRIQQRFFQPPFTKEKENPETQ